MKYLLDTNICIHFFRGRFNLFEKINQVELKNCVISEITLAELIFGAENSDNPRKNHRLSYLLFYLSNSYSLLSKNWKSINIKK